MADSRAGRSAGRRPAVRLDGVGEVAEVPAEVGTSVLSDDLDDAPATLTGALAQRDDWHAGRCSIGRALDVVGTRSAMLLMREAFYGTTRFDDFARRVGITEAVAAARLKELVASGLLARQPYQEPGQRTRYEYVLTRMGRDLLPAAVALMQWGDTYLSGPKGPPLELRHAGREAELCDEPVRAEIRCAAGHQVKLGDIAVQVAAAH